MTMGCGAHPRRWSGLLLLIIVGCTMAPGPNLDTDGNASQQVAPVVSHSAENEAMTYSAIVVPALDSTFGYEIRRNGKLLIQQMAIPTREGNLGFADSTKAMMVAELVTEKLKNGQFPPTLESAELTRLGIP